MKSNIRKNLASGSEEMAKIGYTAEELAASIGQAARIISQLGEKINKKNKEKKMKEEQRSNGEGYRDPTADAAVARADKEKKNANKEKHTDVHGREKDRRNRRG